MKVALWSLAVALAVPLFLFAAYFVHGSFEEFPTEEQHEKARLAAAVGFLFFAALEAIVVGMALGVRRRSAGQTSLAA